MTPAEVLAAVARRRAELPQADLDEAERADADAILDAAELGARLRLRIQEARDYAPWMTVEDCFEAAERDMARAREEHGNG